MKITVKQLKQLIKEQVEEAKHKNDSPLDILMSGPTSLEEMLDSLLNAAAEAHVVGGKGPGPDPYAERVSRGRKVEKIKKDILRYYGDREV